MFDVPGAVGTFPAFSSLLINSKGQIAGYYTDASPTRHGFLRETDGTFVTFDVPGAGTGGSRGTNSFAISERGDITGYYVDNAGATHGFLRDKNGIITPFDVPGSGTGPGQGTAGGGFTPNGTVMGNYVDANDVSHGFLRDDDGTFTTFDVPGAGSVPGSGEGTYPFGIATNGATTGWYIDAGDVNHGFVRDKHDRYTTFDVPGAGTGPGQGPSPTALLRTER